MESNQQSFWQFSDQLRLHSPNLANLSLNDSIWSVNSYGAKKPESRRNFDVSTDKGGFVSKNINLNVTPTPSHHPGSGTNLNGGFNKGVYSKGVNVNNNYNNLNLGYKSQKNESLLKREEENGMNYGGKHGKKNKDNYNQNYNKEKINNNNSDNNGDNGGKSGVDKRFKTLPPTEALARNETVGGYIFVCNNDTMEENLKRQLFGLPPRYRDSVRQITPGLPLFLYNYSTHQLHGIYEASSFGGTNIDPTAWEDKKNPGESRFPAQVRVHTRKICEPLDEDAFRPILHHYDGPKFRLELSVPEALSLLDIFDESDA